MEALLSIFAICKKEFKIALRYPTWFIPMIIWPIGLPLGYIFTGVALAGTDANSLNQFQSVAGTTDFVTFILIGTTVWMVINSMLWSFGSRLRVEQVRGTLESNWLTPVPLMVQLIGRSLFSLVITTINALTVAFLVWLLFGFNIGDGIVQSIMTLIPLLIALLGIIIGFMIAGTFVGYKILTKVERHCKTVGNIGFH